MAVPCASCSSCHTVRSGRTQRNSSSSWIAGSALRARGRSRQRAQAGARSGCRGRRAKRGAAPRRRGRAPVHEQVHELAVLAAHLVRVLDLVPPPHLERVLRRPARRVSPRAPRPRRSAPAARRTGLGCYDNPIPLFKAPGPRLEEGGVVAEGAVLHERLAAAVVLRDHQRAQDRAQVLDLRVHARRLALPARDVHLRARGPARLLLRALRGGGGGGGGGAGTGARTARRRRLAQRRRARPRQSEPASTGRLSGGGAPCRCTR